MCGGYCEVVSWDFVVVLVVDMEIDGFEIDLNNMMVILMGWYGWVGFIYLVGV